MALLPNGKENGNLHLLGVVKDSGKGMKPALWPKNFPRKETVTFEELLTSSGIKQEALVNLLEKKGIITKAELLEEIKRLRERKNSRG